jgi:pimeloyl-ACP methyl ester carboxylesterase
MGRIVARRQKITGRNTLILGLFILGVALVACGDNTPGATPAPQSNPTSGKSQTTAATATTGSATTPAATTVAATTGAATNLSDTGESEAYPPILFVHGNGDSSALWITTIWRFESNGYPRDRLFALDYPYPSARDDDSIAQPGRSGTEEQRNQLASEVDKILAKTGAKKLVLVGNSRGGYSIRNYIKNGGGAAKVSHAILGGTPNHGVYSAPGGNNEFNGASPFLKGLNEGSEVVEGVAFMTVRSDKNDKYAQPELAPGRPSGIDYNGPELKGAKNVVLDGVDHRETAFSPRSFAEMYKFIMGKAPATLEISPEAAPQLSGLITGYENKVPTNLGVAGVQVSVYEVDPNTGARLGAAIHQITTGANGSWGKFTAKPTTYYEFELKAPNQPVMHFFRSPFPRSSAYVSMRLFENPAVAGKAVIYFTRPRGYISNSRDKHSLDGKPVPGVKDGLPTESSFRVELEGPERAVPVSLNGENMTVRAIPGEVVYAEFHY